MTTLNNKAAEIMLAAGDIHSCTDITGFGFLGHALETVAASDVGLHIDSSSLPVIEGVRELAGAGYVPGGLYRNRSHFIDRIEKTARYIARSGSWTFVLILKLPADCFSVCPPKRHRQPWRRCTKREYPKP